MRSLKTKRKRESVESWLISTIPNFLSYIGRFLNKNELQEIFIKKINQVALENRQNRGQKSYVLVPSESKLADAGKQSKPLVSKNTLTQNNIQDFKPAMTKEKTIYEKPSREIVDGLDLHGEEVEYFTYEDLEEHTISLILSNQYIPANLDEFQKLFKAIDTKNTGMVKISYLIQLLKGANPPFSDVEIQRLLTFAGAKTNSETLNYNEYIINFYEFVNSHVKKLYRQKENLIYSWL